MERRLIALKLLLDALDVVPSFWKQNRLRKEIQALVYLAQRAGFSSSYRYIWSGGGLVSEDLTVALYELVMSLDDCGNMPDGYLLSEASCEAVELTKRLLQVPDGFGGMQSEWAECLMVVHHLVVRQEASQSFAVARRGVEEVRPDLSDYSDRALMRLLELDCFRLEAGVVSRGAPFLADGGSAGVG